MKKLIVFYLLFSAACVADKNLSSSVSKIEDKAVEIQEIRVSAADADAAEPSLTSAPDGSVYLVWVEHGANKTADVFLQRFDGDGNRLGEKVRVNPTQGQATAWFGDAPTIKVGGGTIYVGWTAKTGAAKGNDLYLSVSRDGGQNFDAPVKVNDDTKPASHGMHSLAVDKNNRVYLAWLDERNLELKEQAKILDDQETPILVPGFKYSKINHNSNKESKIAKKKIKEESVEEPNSEIFYAVSDDGGKTFSPNKKLSSEVCPCCKTNLVAAPDG